MSGARMAALSTKSSASCFFSAAAKNTWPASSWVCGAGGVALCGLWQGGADGAGARPSRGTKQQNRCRFWQHRRSHVSRSPRRSRARSGQPGAPPPPSVAPPPPSAPRCCECQVLPPPWLPSAVTPAAWRKGGGGWCGVHHMWGGEAIRGKRRLLSGTSTALLRSWLQCRAASPQHQGARKPATASSLWVQASPAARGRSPL